MVKSEGPDLPPLTPGLRHTPLYAIQDLFGAAFMLGLQDEDRRWVESDDYLLVAELAGINLDLAERVRQMFFAGQIKRTAFAGLTAVPPSLDRRAPSQASTVAHPVARVREIAESMPDAEFRELVRACFAAGVNRSTADIQVRKYRAQRSAE